MGSILTSSNRLYNTTKNKIDPQQQRVPNDQSFFFRGKLAISQELPLETTKFCFTFLIEPYGETCNYQFLK